MDGALLEITDRCEIEKNWLNSSIQFCFSGLFHDKKISFSFEHQISYIFIIKCIIVMQIENRGSEVMEWCKVLRDVLVTQKLPDQLLFLLSLSGPGKNATDPIVGKLKISQIANHKHNSLLSVLPPLPSTVWRWIGINCRFCAKIKLRSHHLGSTFQHVLLRNLRGCDRNYQREGNSWFN